jgi:hypothetical protein
MCLHAVALILLGAGASFFFGSLLRLALFLPVEACVRSEDRRLWGRMGQAELWTRAVPCLALGAAPSARLSLSAPETSGRSSESLAMIASAATQGRKCVFRGA